MPTRRSPALAFLLALALVAYPVTMPVVMAGETVAAGHSGVGHGAMHHPATHHHSIAACCTGVCGSCPVLAITAGITPQVRAATRLISVHIDTPSSLEQSVLRRLPYAIGPPASLV
jgi:hypothetical protein